MKKAIVASVLSVGLVFSHNTFASEKSQGILIGAVLATLVIGSNERNKEPRPNHTQVIIQPPNTQVIIQPNTQVIIQPSAFCYYRPYYNDRGMYIGKVHECQYN